MAARAPFDAMAGVLQAAAAAHHRVQCGHQEGDVVERIVVAVAQRQRVVVGIAVHEGHEAGAVGQHQAQRPLQKGLGAGNGMAVEHRMGQAQRLVGRGGVVGRALRVAMHHLEAAAVGIPDHQVLAAGGAGGR